MISGHNIDRYIIDLRSILSLGSKRVGLFIGSGVPASIQVKNDIVVESGGQRLIETIVPMTKAITDSIDKKLAPALNATIQAIGGTPNIEVILSRTRALGRLLGDHKVQDISGQDYKDLESAICKKIGELVSPKLPSGANPYSELVGWISGTSRAHALEIFTTNYDLLLEEALERAKIPYFDGFVGSHDPFFDATSVANDGLPKRWVKLWKIHGSLGWDFKGTRITRSGDRASCGLIYPSELKYEESQKLPYQALFDRLRKFLETPDTLLITCGFSFDDSHIASVFEEALATNPAASIFAFQYYGLDAEKSATALAYKRSNLSVYCRDGAVINCIRGPWVVGEPPTKNWYSMRPAFIRDGSTNELSLGDFKALARFLAMIKSDVEHSLKEGAISV